jgi:YD repeat-containing protein
MTDCCKDNTCKPGTVTAPSDCFDDCRLTLTKEDIKKIDTNNSGALTATELTDALQSGVFNEDKSSMVACIRDHVKNSSVDANIDGKSVKMAATLPNWYSTDFAKQQISKDDFRLIDANGDDILDSGELKGAAGSKLSKMDKHAASVLSDHLDATLNDPLLSVKGGIKNWHNGEKPPEAAAAKAKVDASKIPGLPLLSDSEVSVLKQDSQGRPTEVESSNGVHKLTYDEQDRIVESRTNFGLGDQIKQVDYDDENRTQTITSMGSDRTPYSTITNHIGKNGKVFREDYSSDANSDKATTFFDEDGRIKSQIRVQPGGSRVESSATYNAQGDRTTSSTTRFDDNGVKASETTYDIASKTSLTKTYNAEGQIFKTTEVDHKHFMKPLVRETSYDADGNKKGTADVTFGKPFLVDGLVEKDAQGKVVTEANAQWKTRGGPIGIVESINVKGPDGQVKTLTEKSQGDDQKQFRQLRAKFHNHSHQPSKGDLDSQSPGSYESRLIGAAAC